MGIFDRTVQCRKSRVHILKTSKDSSSNDAQEQANNVEDGCRPQQVVQVDDVLAAADIDVFIVPASDLHPVATVVEVTAEAGIAPDTRCAESTAKLGAIHLSSCLGKVPHGSCRRIIFGGGTYDLLGFLLGCLGDIVASVSIEWFQIDVSGSKDPINYGTTESCNHSKADKHN